METRAFYYWASQHREELERVGSAYKITEDQLLDLHNVIARLLDERDTQLATELLPPLPPADIDDEYWSDLDRTMKILDDVLQAAEERDVNLYYAGDLSVDGI